MLTISQLFDRELNKMIERQWDHIYVVIDMHDTVFKATYANEAPLQLFNAHTLLSLQLMTKSDKFKLIYWSSTTGRERERHIETLDNWGIKFDYINVNPEEASTVYSNFDEKFYMNVILDDKAGFDPETDWPALSKYLLNKLGGINGVL